MPKCVVCGNDMKGAPPHKKCCSESCRKAWKAIVAKARPRESKAQHRDPIPCQFCGEMFTPVNKQNTICRKPECRRAAKQALKAHDFVEKECPVCGKLFRTPNRKQKTCGYSCGRKLRESESKGAYEPNNRPTVIAKCVQCGRNFEREVGSTAKTCSFECAGNLSAAKVAAALWQADPMPDPFPIMQTLIPGVSWSDPIMGAWDGWDSGGVWVCVEEREREEDCSVSAWKKQAVPLVFLRVAMGSLVETNGHIDAVRRVHAVMDCTISRVWVDIGRRAYPISRERQQRTISMSALAMRHGLAKLWESGVEHITELPHGMLFVAEEVLRMMPKDRWPESEKAWRLIACLCLALCRMTDPTFVDLDGTERGESIRNIVMWEAA